MSQSTISKEVSIATQDNSVSDETSTLPIVNSTISSSQITLPIPTPPLLSNTLMVANELKTSNVSANNLLSLSTSSASESKTITTNTQTISTKNSNATNTTIDETNHTTDASLDNTKKNLSENTSTHLTNSIQMQSLSQENTRSESNNFKISNINSDMKIINNGDTAVDVDVEKFDNEMFNLSEMIEREQAKIEEILNPKSRSSLSSSSSSTTSLSSPTTTTSSSAAATAATTNSSRKRKIITAPSVSLLAFINILQDIYMEIRCDDGKIVFKRNLKAYIDENIDAEAKRFRSSATVKTSNVDQKLPLELRQRIYNSILMKVLSFLESNNMTCLFPKETLKFFLATYMNFITPNDFINTNTVIKTERRSKNNTPLSNGAILQEYVKGFDIFISSMPRSDHNDIRALKMIVENNISISHNIYEIINNINFTPPTYMIDAKAEIRSNYSQIAISNAKHIYVLITADILMCYDGNQFVTPQTNIEREFTSHVRHSPLLKSNGRDYVLLEVVFATKSRIVDILQCSINKKTDLPHKYSDRLTFINKVLPNVTLVNITPQTGSNSLDMSYIQKPNEGFEPGYMYHKSHLIAAAVGISEKTVALAFLENDNTFIVKSKVSISGPITCCISAMALAKEISDGTNGTNGLTNEADNTEVSTSNDDVTILYNNRKYHLNGDLNDIRLFKKVISVELRDGNRLGSLSTAPVSKVNEYKPVVARREISMLMRDIEARLDTGDNEFLATLLQNITNTAIPINQTQREMLKRWIEPDINVSFEDYKNIK